MPEYSFHLTRVHPSLSSWTDATSFIKTFLDSPQQSRFSCFWNLRTGFQKKKAFSQAPPINALALQAKSAFHYALQQESGHRKHSSKGYSQRDFIWFLPGPHMASSCPRRRWLLPFKHFTLLRTKPISLENSHRHKSITEVQSPREWDGKEIQCREDKPSLFVEVK